MNVAQKILTGLSIIVFLMVTIVVSTTEREVWGPGEGDLSFQKAGIQNYVIAWAIMAVVYAGLFFILKRRRKL